MTMGSVAHRAWAPPATAGNDGATELEARKRRIIRRGPLGNAASNASQATLVEAGTFAAGKFIGDCFRNVTRKVTAFAFGLPACPGLIRRPQQQRRAASGGNGKDRKNHIEPKLVDDECGHGDCEAEHSEHEEQRRGDAR